MLHYIIYCQIRELSYFYQQCDFHFHASHMSMTWATVYIGLNHDLSSSYMVGLRHIVDNIRHIFYIEALVEVQTAIPLPSSHSITNIKQMMLLTFKAFISNN